MIILIPERYRQTDDKAWQTGIKIAVLEVESSLVYLTH